MVGYPNPKRYTVRNPNPLPAGKFSLRLHARNAPMGPEEEDEDEEQHPRYIVPSNADVLFIPDSDNHDVDEEERAVKIGKIDAFIILLNRLHNEGGYGQFQIICDDHSHELAVLAGEIFDMAGNHRDDDKEEIDQGK
ncbi:hypothetical protein AAF712_006496 [Marasmius tenuissimus]|uniref:Uncharacterized protein n=1 Tax=Marasmius tenuissimus TaxID=585030 RepID=A0ABR2ZZ93_9AGAR|nr:hypothetical protein PM082_013406 [Marasmius tenuissimus]